MKPYLRVSEIERRFEHALDPISSSHLNAQQLADRLDFSLPTAQRMISELRGRGRVIRVVREEHAGRYQLADGAQLPSTAGSDTHNMSRPSAREENRIASS